MKTLIILTLFLGSGILLVGCTSKSAIDEDITEMERKAEEQRNELQLNLANLMKEIDKQIKEAEENLLKNEIAVENQRKEEYQEVISDLYDLKFEVQSNMEKLDNSNVSFYTSDLSWEYRFRELKTEYERFRDGLVRMP